MCDADADGQQRQRADGDLAATPAVALHEHSNANLLKIDTHDKYSTVNALRRQLAKEFPELRGADGQPRQPLFPGLLRMNKNPKNMHMFLAFESEEARRAAAAVLTRMRSHGRPWAEAPVGERDAQLTHKGGRKRAREEQEGGAAAADVSKLTQYERYPLEKQHELKRAHCLQVMKAIVPRQHGWDAYARRFAGLVESPQSEGYRNNVTLTFGRDARGAATLGFLSGSIVDGKTCVESAVDPGRDVVTMHPLSKEVAAAAMAVCAASAAPEKGGLDVFCKVRGSGFWRRMQVRHNVHGEALVDVELDEQSVAPEVFAAVTAELVAALTAPELRERMRRAWGGGERAAVVSVQYHAHTGISSLPPDAPRVVLYGAATLTERLAGLDYELSPTAFFQVNTPGMERLMERVRDVAALTPQTTLLDLCSGTGTIGLTLARHVRRVIGIELVPEAVENARRNAARNGVANAEFRCGRVEELLPAVIASLPPGEAGDIVAILDPPRAGVHGTVLKWIRGTTAIRRAVYISCEQKALLRDCPMLTKPPTKAYFGVPYEVSAGFAVDLFPHTHHVEMVVVLTRQTPAQAAAPGAPTQGQQPGLETVTESGKDAAAAADAAAATGAPEA